MGVYTLYQGKKIKLWKIEIISNDKIQVEKKNPGSILIADDKMGLYIQALDNVIKIVEMQGENAKKMLAEDFLRGNKLETGKILE